MEMVSVVSWDAVTAQSSGEKVWLSPEWMSCLLRLPSCSMTAWGEWLPTDRGGGLSTSVLAQVRQVDCQEFSCRRRLQSFKTNDQCGIGREVDGVLEAGDEVGQRHIIAIAREIAVVGERIDHGTGTSACIMLAETLLLNGDRRNGDAVELGDARSVGVGACQAWSTAFLPWPVTVRTASIAPPRTLPKTDSALKPRVAILVSVSSGCVRGCRGTSCRGKW
jgi:hypothetical protein